MAEEVTTGEVDQPVEEQTDQVLAAVALVIAEAAASQTSGGQSGAGVPWIPVLSTSAKLVVLQYLMRTTRPFASALPGGPLTDTELQPIVQATLDDSIVTAAAQLSAAAPDWANAPAGERSAAMRADARVAARIMVLGTREPVRHELATALGAVYKVWRTRRDDRVRTTHGGLEGNSIPISSEFVTHTGALLRFPHDPLAPISETAGCRCRLSYRTG